MANKKRSKNKLGRPLPKFPKDLLRKPKDVAPSIASLLFWSLVERFDNAYPTIRRWRGWESGRVE